MIFFWISTVYKLFTSRLNPVNIRKLERICEIFSENPDNNPDIWETNLIYIPEGIERHPVNPVVIKTYSGAHPASWKIQLIAKTN